MSPTHPYAFGNFLGGVCRHGWFAGFQKAERSEQFQKQLISDAQNKRERRKQRNLALSK